MRTKMSIGIILMVVTAVAYTAISANERTFAQGRGAGRCNRNGCLSVGCGGYQEIPRANTRSRWISTLDRLK